MSGQIGTGLEAYLKVGGDIDAMPTEFSENAVSSGGVFQALLNAIPGLQEVLDKDGAAFVSTENGGNIVAGVYTADGKTAGFTIGQVGAEAVMNILVQGGGNLAVQTSPGKFTYNGYEVVTVDKLTLQKLLENGSMASLTDPIEDIDLRLQSEDFSKYSAFTQAIDRFTFSSSNGFTINTFGQDKPINLNGLCKIGVNTVGGVLEVTRANTAALTLVTIRIPNLTHLFYTYTGNAATFWTLPTLAVGKEMTISITNRAASNTSTINLSTQNAFEMYYQRAEINSLTIPFGQTIILHCDGLKWIVQYYDYMQAVNSTAAVAPSVHDLNNTYPDVAIGFTAYYTNAAVLKEYTKTTRLGQWAPKAIEALLNP